MAISARLIETFKRASLKMEKTDKVIVNITCPVTRKIPISNNTEPSRN